MSTELAAVSRQVQRCVSQQQSSISVSLGYMLDGNLLGCPGFSVAQLAKPGGVVVPVCHQCCQSVTSVLPWQQQRLSCLRTLSE